MKYWMFQNNQVTGPYEPEDLPTVSGYSAETLVCPEGRKGTNMGDWQRASMVPELAVSLLKVAQLATVLRGSGSIMGGLPPEPTLKDLAALGSLQEKVSLLDDTVGQLQESLKLKDTELLSVHRELEEKENHAKALAIKLGTLEERLNAVNALQEGLDKAVAAEHDVESTVQTQAKTIEELTRQLTDLQSEKARLESAMAGKQDLEDLKEQVREIKDRPAPAAALGAPRGLSAPESKPLDLPAPDASPFGPTGGAPKPLGSLQPEPFSLKPAGPPAPKMSLEAPPLSPEPALDLPASPPIAAPSPIPATVPPSTSIPPAAAAGAKAAVPPSVVGPETAAPTPVPAKKKPNVFIFIVLALGAAGAFGALKLGLLGGHKKASPLTDQTPLPPPVPAQPAAPVKPPEPTPEEILEKKRNDAIALVQAWPAPGGKTVGVALAEGQAPADGSPNPWMADQLHDDVFQVNYYSQKPGLPSQTFEFEAALGSRKVTAHNAPAQDLLTGKSSALPRKPKRKTKKSKVKAAKPKPSAEGPSMLQDILVVNPEDDKATPETAAPSEEAPAPAKRGRKSRVKKDQPIENLDDFLSGASEPAPKPRVRPKAAPPKPDESLDQLLVPGARKSDLDEPQAQPAPMKADDAENAADEGQNPAAAPAQKQKAAGTDEVLDDLLKP